MSRIKSSSKNVFFGVFQQITTILLTFITRTVFIRYLEIELLGINSLFSNILTVFSIADLGFGTAIMYSMYQPMAEKNEKKISALMNFYKKIYTRVAIIVFIIGISLLPFLKYLIKENNIENISFYYLLFLLDSVVSYLYAYKVNIINADQKTYIIKRFTLFFHILKAIFQCLTIIIFRNFIVYILIQILTTISINIYGAYIAKKMYPFIDNKEDISDDEKKNILKNVKSLFIYKVGGVILNNTDNILISTILGVAIVGYYTNYFTIVNSITSITTIIFSTITYSVGNMIATDLKEKQYSIFKKLEFMSTIIFSFSTICLYILLDDLITCWLGNTYLIDKFTVISVCINFYIIGILNSTVMFRDTTGLFNDLKYLMIVTAMLNIILSIVLGKLIGLCGIIVATAISRIVTNFWYEPYMLHKKYFNKSSKEYFKLRFDNIFCIIFISIIISMLFSKFIVNNWIDLIFKTIIVVIITAGMLFIKYRNNDECKYYIDILKKLKIKYIK